MGNRGSKTEAPGARLPAKKNINTPILTQFDGFPLFLNVLNFDHRKRKYGTGLICLVSHFTKKIFENITHSYLFTTLVRLRKKRHFCGKNW